ncbi:Methyltransferase-like protein 27 [Holothuria leucospilota]|uniref:Methyltransferase-like protein 27 n=1 Tax=Holothuria leucospilota TaxID=206669 RepID=A0A9Q1HG91_HOLLE|nr:Methyltransferase-like protein 27 [Holothuria leucospilota]
MTEFAFSVSLMTEVLDHIKNSKDVSINSIKEMYDSWVPTYDEDLRKHNYRYPAKASEIISEHFSDKNVSILDCGAGTGLVGVELYRLGFKNIAAVDISSKSLAAAEKKGVYKKLVCAEVGKGTLPFDDKCFDAVMCSASFMPTHIRPECLPELVRIVKPGGIIVVLMAQRYIEVVAGDEECFCKYYQLEFEEVTQDLEGSKKWKLISKNVIPNLMLNKAALTFVWKVL